jgi:hypothetical protein
MSPCSLTDESFRPGQVPGHESGEIDELRPTPDSVHSTGSEKQDQAIGHPAQGSLDDPLDYLTSYLWGDSRHFRSSLL